MSKALNLTKLVDFIYNDPKFKENWSEGEPKMQGLYIELNSPDQSRDGIKLESQVFDMPDGSQLVLDIDKDGKVWGIEIV